MDFFNRAMPVYSFASPQTHDVLGPFDDQRVNVVNMVLNFT